MFYVPFLYKKNPEYLLLPAFQVLVTYVFHVVVLCDGETVMVFVKYTVVQNQIIYITLG